ncbi:Surfactin synthase thioesterase subunit [Paenibacillus sp. UNC496MF]|uniref:thioesterase II family protein n=1 Tax=Paenibacillus sp. UNC496MF TaxID=1502753 RepID=UPI0008F06AA6|nr:alpha/beta fold hydrolase [Paenibacillus sp. UNC496MF]SFJ55839.1 Surfactin synthase thioesterase subunit [Paenibacillus sp. UNC496MF]
MERKIRLYCFPFAGGTAQMYHSWAAHVNAAIELVPIELSGRGRRFPQPLFTHLADIVEDVRSLLQPEIDQKPYMLFGHSMGSLIAYELAKKVMQHGNQGPLHIFFSGRSSPNQSTDTNRSRLPDEELKKEIIQFGGTPKELLDDPGFIRMFLPIIRADMKAVETYPTEEEITPLPCNISIFNGKQDHLVTHLEKWKPYTTKEIEYRFFEGGHFYLLDHTREVVDAINQKALEFYNE